MYLECNKCCEKTIKLETMYRLSNRDLFLNLHSDKEQKLRCELEAYLLEHAYTMQLFMCQAAQIYEHYISPLVCSRTQATRLILHLNLSSTTFGRKCPPTDICSLNVQGMMLIVTMQPYAYLLKQIPFSSMGGSPQKNTLQTCGHHVSHNVNL